MQQPPLTMTERWGASCAMQQLPGAHDQLVRVYADTGDWTLAIRAVLRFRDMR